MTRAELPPDSPVSFVQQELRPDEWRVLVGCALLNRTTHVQARPALKRLFDLWPTPTELASANEEDVAEVIRACGLYRARSRRLIALSAAYRTGMTRAEQSSLPGVGKYAMDSLRLFIDGDTSVEPTDKELKKYKAFLIETGNQRRP